MTSRPATSNAPRFARADFAALPFACEAQRDGGQTWYRGSGIAPEEHPLARHIPFGGCQGCGAADVHVIAAHHDVHLMSGDVYYDYELVCRVCGVFTRRSYSENG